MSEIVKHRDGTQSEVHVHTFSDGTRARIAWNPTTKQFVAALPEAPDQMVVQWLHLSAAGKWTDIALEPRRSSLA